MNRFQKSVYLPPPKTAEEADLYKRLQEIFRDVALVTREIQAPPVLRVDLNGSDQSLTVSVTNTINFVKARTGAIDTHGWWSDSTHKYTPKEAGYYQVNFTLKPEYPTSGLVAAGAITCSINVNGAVDTSTVINVDDAAVISRTVSVSNIVYLNGTTDYVDCSATYASGTALVAKGLYSRSFLSIVFLGGVQTP